MVAAATYTCTIYGSATRNMPKVDHVGDVSISGKIVHVGTVDDVLFLCKIPHGATIVDFYESHTNGATAAAYGFGLSKGVVAGGGGDLSCLILSGDGVVGATTQRVNLAAWDVAYNFPPSVSLSDSDPVRYAAVCAKATSGTFTVSVSLRFCLTYRMDNPHRGGSEI